MLIRPGAIGDCILSLPAMLHLKAGYTEVWISSPAVPLIQFADCVRSIASTQLDLVIGEDLPLGLERRLGEFDEVVSWYGSNRDDFRRVMDSKHRRWVFLEALPDYKWHAPASDFFLRQVGGEPGILPRIDVEATERRKTVVIHPFSGSARKNWPLERFRELAARLPVAADWTAGPEEELESAWRSDNLLDLARWMKGAAVYVGNDSGISHLAAAIGVPSVVLFGASDANVWAPRGGNVRIVQQAETIEPVRNAVLEFL